MQGVLFSSHLIHCYVLVTLKCTQLTTCCGLIPNYNIKEGVWKAAGLAKRQQTSQRLHVMIRLQMEYQQELDVKEKSN